MTAEKTGLLLINLGTPSAPTPEAVRSYLREFLSDPRVISIPGPLRWLLVNLVIAPFRAPKSAEAYRSIWTDRGSPLLVHSQDLAEKMRARLDALSEERGAPKVHVELAMRYGTPGIPGALEKMRRQGVGRIVVFPLYPHYASSTTGSSAERVLEVAKAEWAMPALAFVPAFYDHPRFLDAVVEAGREAHEAFAPDHVLFSYHGLPEEHVTMCDPTGQHCLKSDACCDAVVEADAFCYRAQCVATTRGLVERLGLGEDDWSFSFQSRLGRQPWLKPYTDDVLVEIAGRGKKRLAVYCPAFVADCLETLEEIGIRARADFRAAGGEDLKLMPCLNAHDAWVEAALDIAATSCGWLPPPPHRPIVLRHTTDASRALEIGRTRASSTSSRRCS